MFGVSFSPENANKILSDVLGADHGIVVTKGEAGRGHSYDRDRKVLYIDPQGSRQEDELKVDILCACLEEILPEKAGPNLRVLAVKPGISERVLPIMIEAVRSTFGKTALELDHRIEIPTIQRDLVVAMLDSRLDGLQASIDRANELYVKSRRSRGIGARISYGLKAIEALEAAS